MGERGENKENGEENKRLKTQQSLWPLTKGPPAMRHSTDPEAIAVHTVMNLGSHVPGLSLILLQG